MRRPHEYPDDFFADSRMSFGDHLEELRSRLIKAFSALAFFMVFGFVLDGIGTYAGLPWLGVGKPVMTIIKKPVEDAMADFFNERLWNQHLKEINQETPKTEEERAKLEEEKFQFLKERRERIKDDSALAVQEINHFRPIQIRISKEELKKQVAAEGDTIDIPISIKPYELAFVLSESQNHMGRRQTLSTLSAQEAFLVYLKVSMLCGFVLAAPFIFWQFWAFIGAGLYPHEKEYVNKFFPFSIVLFVSGIVLCQFFVLPGTLRGLLAFNSWLDLDPDIRLSEWLTLALLLPLIFGLSFQTPLVMLVLNQLGLVTVEDYWAKWRHAVMVLTVFAVVVTPTPDVVTMLYLLIPMVGLYFLGIYICKLFPQRSIFDWADGEENSREVAV